MNWVFTWNNPPYDESQVPPNVWPDVAYAAWQHEVGENGTPHYQGYIQLQRQYTLHTLKKNMPEGIHWEPRRGTHQQAKEYAMKNSTRDCGPWEFGHETHQGRDSALMPMLQAVKEGKPELEVAAIDPLIWARYFRAIERYRQLVTPVRQDGQTVFTTVYWGDTDIGKSWRAQFEAVQATGVYYKLATPQDQRHTVWWDDYKGEEDVIIDEFSGQISLQYMNTICDRYKCRVQTKGGSVLINMRRLWITSNDNPISWWPNKGIDPFLKRITGANGKCEHLTQPWRPETDGELLIADVEDAIERKNKKNQEIAALKAQLQMLQAEDEATGREVAAAAKPIPLARAMGMPKPTTRLAPYEVVETEESKVLRRMNNAGRYTKTPLK